MRLLSAGSPIQRVKLANIFGAYRYNVVSFTNHKVHPGEPSTFDDISIEGVFCSKSGRGMDSKPAEDISSNSSPIWIDAPAVVSNLIIRDYHRTEAVIPSDDIHIEPGATVNSLTLTDMTLVNRCESPINMLHNRGTIGNLALANVCATAEVSGSGGHVAKNAGTVRRCHHTGIAATGYELGTSTEALDK